MRGKSWAIPAAVSLFCFLSGCGSQTENNRPSLAAINAWGDSLTAGHEGYFDLGEYPADLSAMLLQPDLANNFGVGGQTSTQIGVRVGAIPTEATVSGGSIPESGPVGVTFLVGYEPVTSQGPSNGVTGTILGVHGTVTYTTNGLVFTRDKPGDAVSAPNPAAFTVDDPYIGGYTHVFWECRNNYGNSQQCQSDLQKQIAFIKSDPFLVLGVINENTPGEWIGGSGYTTLTNLNAALAAAYGAHYLDIRKVLVDSYSPSLVTDISDYNHDEPPTSLRAEFGHGTLVSPVGPFDTTMTFSMSSGAHLVPGLIATVDSGGNAENVFISAVAGSTVTAVRNQGGNDTAHPADASVQLSDPIHLNAQGYQIVAQAIQNWIERQH